MESILYILFGWLLGLLGPVIVDSIKRKRRRDEFVVGVLRELSDLRFRMGTCAFGLRRQLATINHEFLIWLQPINSAYDGPEKTPEAMRLFDQLLKLSDEDLKKEFLGIPTPGKSISLPTLSLGFLSQQMGLLAPCPIDFQQRIGMIHVQLDLWNQEVEFTRQMFDKTFDPSIIGENRNAVCLNIQKKYQSLAERAKLVADAVTELKRQHRG